MTELALELSDCWVEAELAREFPELGLVHAPVEARPGRSPADVKRRLRALADRYTGGKVIHMRQDPVPWAYRVFARQVGIDPDRDRTPVEAAAGESLGPARPLAARQIVIADSTRPVALVLGEAGEDTGVTPRTERMVLCALAVKGVPRISVEEALWIAAEVLVKPYT